MKRSKQAAAEIRKALRAQGRPSVTPKDKAIRRAERQAERKRLGKKAQPFIAVKGGPGQKTRIWHEMTTVRSDKSVADYVRTERRIREERRRHSQVVVTQGCTCPRNCDLHP